MNLNIFTPKSEPEKTENQNRGFRALDSIEDVDDFYSAINRKNLTKKLSESRPYTYWTIELYDQENGIRGGGGLGILAADTRRVAEYTNVPLTLVTPFYPKEPHQKFAHFCQNIQVLQQSVAKNDQVLQQSVAKNGQVLQQSVAKLEDEHKNVNYEDFGFEKVDSIYIHCNNTRVKLDVVQKIFGETRILSITEPNFGELYQGESGSDHRLYQEVALGFGGYQALKLVGLKPAIMQLNECATFFAAVARLDELASNGMDFYEAVVYTRKHTLYTNHTLVQAAEAEFSYDQFERYVFPNVKSKAVKKWLSDKFNNGRIKLSTVTIEIAELRSGVSKLHARVANYHDLAGERVKFKAVTNGIDMKKWVNPEIIKFYRETGIIDDFTLPTENFAARIEETLTAEKIKDLKKSGRRTLNETLKNYPDQNGKIWNFGENDFIFTFKRRFVDYKRPELPFSNPKRLREVLEAGNAYYLLTGRLHLGDGRMIEKLNYILSTVNNDDYLKTHVAYLPDYDEKLAKALSEGANAAINVPIVGLEACGTSWEKDIANLDFLISTHDGGVADASPEDYLNIPADPAARIDMSLEEEATGSEADWLYRRMAEAIAANDNPFDLERILKRELTAYLPTISGARMLRDYLTYLFE